jgi:radical SAM-linked protein
MARRVPEGPPPPPVVQRVRIRYAKRGRLRFTSHRDFARAFERALRRAQVPMAYSAGFSPHPKISYVGASPTGVASEAEYLEIGLAHEVDVNVLRVALDDALPPGLDLVETVVAAGSGFADRMHASAWRIDLPGLSVEDVEAAVGQFLQAETVGVERLTKNGRRTVDVRAAVLTAAVSGTAQTPESPSHAILDTVVRQVTPTVWPGDIVAALSAVAGLAPVVPPVAVRLAQGPLDVSGAIGDPLAADRAAATQTP